MPRPLVWFLPLQVVLVLVLSLAFGYAVAPDHEHFALMIVVSLTFCFSLITILMAWSAFTSNHWTLRMAALAAGVVAIVVVNGFIIGSEPFRRQVTIGYGIYVLGGMLAAVPWRLAGLRWVDLAVPSKSPDARFQVSIAMLLRWTAICAGIIFLARRSKVRFTDPDFVALALIAASFGAVLTSALTVALSTRRFPWKTCLLLPTSVAPVTYVLMRLAGFSNKQALTSSTLENPFLFASLLLVAWIAILRHSGYRIRRGPSAEELGGTATQNSPEPEATNSSTM